MRRYEPTRLTESFIAGLPMDGRDTYDVRDTRVVGLILAVNKRCKTYKVQRELWRGERGRRRLVKTVRKTIGRTDELTLEQARLKAQDMLRQIALGTDPNERAAQPQADGWTVETMFNEYFADMRKRECAEVSIANALASLNKYLADLKAIPITELTRSMVRGKHHDISVNHGKIAANMAMRSLRAAYNLALRIVDDPDALPDNPVKAVTFNKERRKNAVIDPQDLAAWWENIERLPNPLRRLMHELGLFSGLRPGTLVSLRRNWIKLHRQTISIPRMKSGRSFDLPLSAHMVAIVTKALEFGDMLFPGTPWLFPTRASADNPAAGIVKGQVIATQVWREKVLPSDTGHILRHTYRTIAQRITLDQIEARLLLDHKVQGIDGVYIHEKALFDRLLVAQERMTAELLRLTRASRVSRPPAARAAQADAAVGSPF